LSATIGWGERVGEVAQLYGRSQVSRFVTDSLDRSGKPERPPAVLLLGVCGSGKSALLEKLAADPIGPLAQIDFAGDPEASPRAVMLAIRQALSRRVPCFGTVSLPLLKLGLNALSLDPEGGTSPEEQLERRLQGREEEVTQVLLDTAQQAARLLPPDQQVLVTGTATLLGWLKAGINRRQLQRQLSWYADLAGPGNGAKLGPLLELYQQWLVVCSGAPANQAARPAARRAVWRVLCAALLADLRADFNDFSWRHGQRTAGCLLLLDNADTLAGRGFLQALTQCRKRSPGDSDPLVVVAAQATRPAPALGVGAPVPASDHGLRYAAWLEEARTLPDPPLWQPIELTDLSREQVEHLVSSRALGTEERDAEFVHALTGGNPAVTRDLARTLGRVAADCDVRGLLELPATDCDLDQADEDADRADELPESIGDHLLRRLRPAGVTDNDLRAMAICGATPGIRQGACSSAMKYLGWADVAVPEVQDLLLRLMWADQAPDGALILRPLPRLLLTRELAGDDDTWEQAHYGYLSYYSARGMADMHYHDLARTRLPCPDNLHRVASFIDQDLTERPAGTWIETLRAITAAPHQLSLTAPDTQRALLRQLAGPREPQDRLRVVTRLVAARWLLRDRLFDPTFRLAKPLAEAYSDLAELTEGGSAVLESEAGKFRQLAAQWEDIP
jgi:hypothetical protein